MTDPRYILLAEDNLPMAELVLMAARIHAPELRVEHALDGADALDFLHAKGRHRDRQGDLPAVILLDLKMPRVDGFRVLREIRGDDLVGAVPVVVLTSSRNEDDIRNAYRLGANAFIVKPLSFTELQNIVSLLVDFWTVANEVPVRGEVPVLPSG